MGGGGGSSAADFGRWLRSARDAAQLTQEELAERAAVSVRTIQTLEAGRIKVPRQATQRRLRTALAAADQQAGPTEPAGPADPVEVGQPDRVVPAQLPLDVYGFVGRDTAMARLDALLDARLGAPADSQPVAVAAVLGTAGVGKTSLAVHWAHRVRHRFADGQLYVDLRGFDPQEAPLDPGRAVCWLLDGLGVAAERIPADDSARFAVYRSLLAGRRMLVVLDNAATEEQVRPLLPGTSGSLVLVTSRSRLPGLVAADGAHPIVLDLLSRSEAAELLAQRLGRDRAAAEPAAVDEIAARCAMLPLALAIAAASAVTNPSFGLRALAAELGDRRYCLDALSTGAASTDLRAVFSSSYRVLGAPAARLFRLLGLCGDAEVGVSAAARLAGVDPVVARRLLAELARVHLVGEPSPWRYTMHDLLRAYAAELAELEDSSADRLAAISRLTGG